MQNKSLLTLAGFILFVIGFLSLVFTLVGINFTFLDWLESVGATTALVVKLLMMFGGIIMVYISKSDPTP